MSRDNKMTIIASKGSLDWAFPPFIIASTAAAMDKKVTIFFTFYGLKLLLKDLSSLRISVQGNPAMPMKMPFGPKWLQKIDFAPKIPNIFFNIPGMELFATKMMQKTMKNNNIASIDELREAALEAGVKMIACEMTMDMFGYTKEDFIDNIEYAGAATYIDITSQANNDLFI